MKNINIILFVLSFIAIYTPLLIFGYQTFESREYTTKYVEGHYEVGTTRNEHTGEEFWVEGHTEKVLTSNTFYYFLFSLMFGLTLVPSYLLLKLYKLQNINSKAFSTIWNAVVYFNIVLIVVGWLLAIFHKML